MYSDEIYNTMQNILFLIILFLSCGVSAQAVEENQPVYNNTSNSVNAPATITISSEGLTDTLSIEMESKSKKNSGKVRAKSTIDDLDQDDQKKEESSSAPSVQSATQSFSVSKSSAAQSRTQRTPNAQTQIKMDEAVDQLSVTAPESFEYHFYSYQAGNYNIDLVDHLNKAETMRPNNSDVQIQKASYHLIKGENDLAVVYLEKLKNSTRLSQEVINYSEDLLLSAPVKGTLITHGFDDGFGVNYHQKLKGTRKDVELISLDFLQSQHYRKKLVDKGFVLPKREIVDVAFLKEFCELNVTKGISISTTVPKEYLTGISDKLFVAGLVFEYRKEAGYDNFNRNEELWDSELKKVATSNVLTEKGKQLSANYLPMLLHLRQVYEQKGESEKKKKIDAAIDQIAVQSNKYEQVKKLKQSY
jgi:hypothetical protein